MRKQTKNRVSEYLTVSALAFMLGAIFAQICFKQAKRMSYERACMIGIQVTEEAYVNLTIQEFNHLTKECMRSYE